MTFANPHCLWLLLLLPVAVMLWAVGRRPAALAFSDVRLLQPLPRGGVRRATWLRVAGRLLALALLVVALARPRWPDENARIPARSAALIFVLDVSGSMAEEDYRAGDRPVSRLTAARGTLRRF